MKTISIIQFETEDSRIIIRYFNHTNQKSGVVFYEQLFYKTVADFIYYISFNGYGDQG